MNKNIVYILLGMLLVSEPVFALASSCNSLGFTVIYVNGILTNKRDAQDDTYFLKTKFEKNIGKSDVAFINGYNESHIGGAGDLIESASQLLGSSYSNYDRDTILLQIHPEVTTRKILLVGHSQGTFYTNEIYNYLIANGETKESVGVYNIATPASFVSGDGAYLTSENDKVINAVRVAAEKIGAKQPLTANISIPLTTEEAADSFGGHSFSGVYLANDSVRIVYDAESALKKLLSGEVSNLAGTDSATATAGQASSPQAGCFTPPAKGLTYYAKKSVFAFADTAAEGAVAANGTLSAVGETAYSGSLAAVSAVGTGVKNTFAVIQSAGEKSANAVAQVLNLMGGTVSSAIETAGGKLKSASVIDSLGGVFSSVTGDNLKLAAIIDLGEDNLDVPLSGTWQKNNLAARDDFDASLENSEFINVQDFANDTQDEDSAERIANAKKTTANPSTTATAGRASSGQTAANSNSAGVSVGSGQGEVTVQQCKYSDGGAPTRQKLIFNEVAWMGGTASANDEWVELKNISGGALDVSGWQVLDKNEDIKVTLANGTKMSAGGFYLLERTDDSSVPGIAAGSVYAGALSNSDEGLRLFDNNCNLVDEVLASPSWPAGESASRRTMERSSTGSLQGGADLSWHAYNGSGENNIWGTPKSDNTIPTSTGVGTTTSDAPVGAGDNVGADNNALANLLISEVQTTGGTGQSDNEFVELYNPNDSAVDLSALPLKLHIRNSSGTDSHKTLTLINTAIPAKGYFLIGPSAGYAGAASLDATYSASSGNKLVNNGGVYISKSVTADTDVLDKVGWGTQPAGGYETSVFSGNPIVNQSISRNTATDAGNNSADFIKSKPTPKNSGTSGGFLNPDAWAVLEQLVNHLVISEVYPDRTGANKDFVELYNPNATSTGDLDISGWSLQVLSAGATTTDGSTVLTTSKISKKNFAAGNKISGRRFFLIGLDDYSGGDMTWASGSLNSTIGATVFLVNGTTTISDIADSRIIDRVSYGNGSAADFAEAVPAPMPESGRSLERKAFQNDFCVSASGAGEYLGNGCDTDDNSADFEIRASATVQRISNLAEPRTAPLAVQNFSGTYDPASLKMNLSWDLSRDSEEATSTVSYILQFATSTNPLKDLATLTATSSYNFKLSEVGIDYNFSIKSKDRDGFVSGAVATSSRIPSILTGAYFYPDPRTASTTAVELRYGSYPFIYPAQAGAGFRVAAVYKNREAPAIPIFYSDTQYATTPDGVSPKEYGEWGSSISGAWRLRYENCSGGFSEITSIILPDTGDNCSANYGGIRNGTVNWNKLEDLNLIVNLASSQDAPVSGDYFTLGFYYYTGYNTQTLVAIDRQKYYFQNETPAHQPPELGGVLAVNFSAQTSKLEIEWQKAVDLDTLDSLITYEVSYDGGMNWQSAGAQNKTQKITAPGQSFAIQVRAKDDFGNYSDPPLAASWPYPETVFQISQNQSNDWSLSFGTKNPNCPSCAGTASLQSIQPQEDLEFNTVTLKLKQELVSDIASLALVVYSDLNGLPDFDMLIAESQLTGMIRPDPDSDIAFTFDSPVPLSAQTKYWLVLSVKEYSDSRGYYRNQWQNAINAGSDLYGYGQAGRGNSGTCDGYCDFTVPYPDASADWYMKIGLSE